VASGQKQKRAANQRGQNCVGGNKTAVQKKRAKFRTWEVGNDINSWGGKGGDLRPEKCGGACAGREVGKRGKKKGRRCGTNPPKSIHSDPGGENQGG